MKEFCNCEHYQHNGRRGGAQKIQSQRPAPINRSAVYDGSSPNPAVSLPGQGKLRIGK
jgi:hypothetical protein